MGQQFWYHEQIHLKGNTVFEVIQAHTCKDNVMEDQTNPLILNSFCCFQLNRTLVTL